MTTPREIIAEAYGGFFPGDQRGRRTDFIHADILIRKLTAVGYRIVGPDDVALITTALEHASFALDGVVALDDEDEGKDGASKTCQHTKRTVDRALTAIRAIASGGKQ